MDITFSQRGHILRPYVQKRQEHLHRHQRRVRQVQRIRLLPWQRPVEIETEGLQRPQADSDYVKT